MASPKITFYDLSHKEYEEIVSIMGGFKLTCLIELREAKGNPPIYSRVTVGMAPDASFRSNYTEAKRTIKGLVNLLEFE